MANATLAIVRDLVRCLHEAPAEIGEGRAWCAQCGALYSEQGGWFRSSAAASLEWRLGVHAVSDEARRLYVEVERREPYTSTLAELVQTHGMRPVFELVCADLLSIDARDRAAASRRARLARTLSQTSKRSDVQTTPPDKGPRS